MNPTVMGLAALLEIMDTNFTTMLKLSPALVGLFQNDFTPLPTSVPADFTAATYDGYASLSTTILGTAIDDDNSNARLEYDANLFQPTGSGTSNVIYGWYIVGGVGTTFDGKVIAAKRFPAPITLATPDDGVVVQPTVAINQPVGI